MEEFKRLKRELVCKGAVVDMYKDYVKTPTNTTVEWDFIAHIGAAAVVPVTSEGKILMVRQWRNAVDRYTLEIPAGGLDSVEESMYECAKRELEEETGYKSRDLEKLISLRMIVALGNELIEVYVAKNLEPSKQNLDLDEYINVEAYDIDTLLDMIYDGQIEDSKTVAALLAYSKKYCS